MFVHDQPIPNHNSTFTRDLRTEHAAPILIIFYSVIFILSIAGNLLVILTLIQNKRMRTITNIFLLNLAVSDLLLGVFCMPFTLVGALLKNFIFGNVMCKLIPYFQAVSVSVSSYSLVALSVERYYAICHPLLSRRWQTLSHSYRIIVVIWVCSLLGLLPIPILSTLQPLDYADGHKCREAWPSRVSEMAFNGILTSLLLVLPLVILTFTYWNITMKLRQGIKSITCMQKVAPVTEEDISDGCDSDLVEDFTASTRFSERSEHRLSKVSTTLTLTNGVMSEEEERQESRSRKHYSVRSTHLERTINNKKRVVTMLCVVVLEFFICWTPLTTMTMISVVDDNILKDSIGHFGRSFVQLLAFTSSCCNPITYCFMNHNFRQAFKRLFYCRKMGNHR